jgi:predicted acylesterase/phospholipase RssA
VAASGGASRAGFFTASVIGKYLDEGGADFRKRLFAISSVSGSSVGAVMTVAALAASPDAKPCRDEDFWLLYQPKANNWRTCLEALMSGDFLTPVFAGLVFRDTLRFLGVFSGSGSFLGWSDRASLIEQSWERHFRRSVREQKTPSPDCRDNLDCPFLALRPRTIEGRVEWLPLLLLNGASVSTGQRIVTSIIDPWYRPGGACPLPTADDDPGKCPVLDYAYDFHWMLSDASRASGWIAWLHGLFGLDKPSAVELNDVRQSTAAHNSARFPFISPPGEVRNRTNNVVDRIVDGGYFENFGAQTALELASAVRAVDSKLAPFILIISNDPEIPTDDVLKAPDASEGAFLSDVSAPVQAIMNTRAARGTLALNAIATVLAAELGPHCRPYAGHIRAWPEYEDREGNALPEGQTETRTRRVRPLSFSWWLSKPVQMRLHQQTEFSDEHLADNRLAMDSISQALGPKPDACATQPQPTTSVLRKFEGVRPLLQLQRQRQ